jgi:hypothetical protein
MNYVIIYIINYERILANTDVEIHILNVPNVQVCSSGNNGRIRGSVKLVNFDLSTKLLIA